MGRSEKQIFFGEEERKRIAEGQRRGKCRRGCGMRWSGTFRMPGEAGKKGGVSIGDVVEI